MSVPYRCNRCRQRKSFTDKQLRAYKTDKSFKCSQCSGIFKPDKYRIKNEKGRTNICNCGGYLFEHRKGSKFCFDNSNIPTPEELEEHFNNHFRGKL